MASAISDEQLADRSREAYYEVSADRCMEGHYGSSSPPWLKDIFGENATYHIINHRLQKPFPSEFRYNIDPRGSNPPNAENFQSSTNASKERMCL